MANDFIVIYRNTPTFVLLWLLACDTSIFARWRDATTRQRFVHLRSNVRDRGR